MAAPAGSICVFGAGSWGTALAWWLAQSHPTSLWGRNSAAVQEMREKSENHAYLKGVALPASLNLVEDIGHACAAEAWLLTVPIQGLRDLLQKLRSHLRPQQQLWWACKGLERETGLFAHEIVAGELTGRSFRGAAFSGPTFAFEIARGLPAAMVVAAPSEDYAKAVAQRLHSPKLRLYSSTDMIGVALGGAVKNVLAIASGIVDGLNLGANARAALMTRGMAEMMRLGNSLDAQPETLSGLSGLGDLMLTCTGDLSRNRRLGLAIGRGLSVEAAAREIGQAIEGLEASRQLMQKAGELNLELPITTQTYRVLFKGISPQEAMTSLMARGPRSEANDNPG